MPSDNPDTETETGTGTEVLLYCNDHQRPCDHCTECNTLSYCPQCDRCYGQNCDRAPGSVAPPS